MGYDPTNIENSSSDSSENNEKSPP
ncbi:hypothetical protein JL09_g5858 [Pichia kudriavzevii]|uniref:Uncharacterized protein n=1 Tax=Pichia kudriavzevii TaxID=4909 RepID=A0A099NQH1_PICKU|nr:hypothetical protein JL09_g5858 [Pichia kudriavzevii]